MSYDATFQHRRLFTSCLGQLCLEGIIISTSLNRNTSNYSNYSTCSSSDVGAFDLSLSVTYECRDDDQNQEDSELHGVADHFTLLSALS